MISDYFYQNQLWKATFDTENYKNNFQEPEYNLWHRSLPATADGARDRVFSKSYIAVLPEKEKAELEASISEILRKGDGMKWIDEKEGVFKYPYETQLIVMKRK